jgi:para-aminobenzoate synthetase/4-amino-4-deoxychorismate lyase
VKSLFDVEQYPNVFQMTSTITSSLKKHTSVDDLVRAMFPSGSITGAPKISCMKILRKLEREERKIYTGAIGFFSPDGGAKFNVAIRTVLLEGNKGEMGVGGGIVADSGAESEYAEAKLKGSFLVGKRLPDFQLIEALLYDNGLKRLGKHISRLKESLSYFGSELSLAAIRNALTVYAGKLGKGRYKVRLLVKENGEFVIRHEKRSAIADEYKIGLAKHRTDSADVLLYHKTTSRASYEKERATAAKRGLFDVLFFNEKNELTEGARTNVYLEKEGQLFTPAQECGLLNGIIRRELVSKGKARQRVLSKRDLIRADAVYISNAIIGLQKAKVIR